jgi:pyrroline-5-carboxylate reductase
MKLGFIGGGNMAAAMIGGLLKKGFAARDICVSDLHEERRNWLQSSYGVPVEATAAECLKAEVIILAVKPQQARAVLTCLPRLDPGQLVLSVAAGIRSADISRWLSGHDAVVRAMPNTPALIGAGMAGLFAAPAVTVEQRQQADTILGAVGEVVWVNDEQLIDAVTAISGSGPAYVFHFIEALQDAGVELGLNLETARKLAVQTFLGAASLAWHDTSSLAELRERVTSKGGTTERGLQALFAADVAGAIRQAARAAAARACEMGDLFASEGQ